MSRESGGSPERGGNHNGGANKGGANSGSSSNGGGGGKGGGRNDSGGANSSSKIGNNKGKNDTASPSSSRGSIGPIGGASMYGGESVRNAMTKDNSNKNGGSKVSDRLASVSKTLGTYSKTPATSAPAYARPGYGDTLNAQRNQLAGPVSGGGPSSMGSAASYGMSEDDFNKSIGTDNFNGVIGNLQEKALRRTASEDDRSSMDTATRDYNNLRGAGVLGSAIAGKPGQWAAQQATNAAMDAPGDYLAGMTRKAAMEQLDKGRLIGQRGQLGDGGVGDSAVKGGVSLLGAAIPGGSLITSGISSGLTVGAPGLGNLLNDINARLGNTISRDDTSQGSDRGYTSPPRQTPTSNNQAGDLTFDSNYYDPSRFNVTTGKRGY
jgi:hypothetical protein